MFENFLSFCGKFLYSFRIVMLFFYGGLALIVLLLAFKFLGEFWSFSQIVFTEDTKKIHLIIKTLELVDMVMVVQLVWVVTMAGVSLFVSNRHFENSNVSKPDWLDHVTTYNLKLKLAFAIISISGVHALKTYLTGNNTDEVLKLAAVHLLFVFSAIGLAYAEKLTKSD
jgi:uncharacterized protein (TIGR00645 family)